MLLLALVVQVGVVGLLLLFGALDAAVEPRPLAPPQAVNLAQVSGQDWEHNREVNGQSPPVTAPPKQKKDKPEPENGQVVATPPGNEEKPDESAKYLAESNNRVDKESRSERTDPNYRNPASRPSGPLASRAVPTTPGKKAGGKQGESEDRPIRGSKADQRALEIPTVQPRDEIALEDHKGDLGAGPKVANREGTQAIQGNSDRLRVHPRGEEDGAESGASSQKGQNGKLILSPSAEVLDRIAGAPPPDDLRDVEKGDGLFLNTREFKYASFFNRVKQFVGMNWDPVTPMRLRDPSGEIYGNKDRYTLLTITLDASGQLEDARVESSSGLEFLDLAAVQAFQKAQPFPNPPPGLLADDHKVRFSFGFSLELGGAGRMRLFRQAN